MTETKVSRRWQRWALPATCVAIAIAYFVAGMVSDRAWFALFGAGLMLTVAAVFLLVARHSETARGLLERRDERINAIDKDASLFAGLAVLLATLVMFVVEIARGRDGSPYSELGVLGGLSYLLALVWLRFRR